ncbi:calcium-binding protein, partial [Sinorhizobium americanum]
MGVTISVDDGYGLDMREIDFNALLYADSYYRSSTVFTADYGIWSDQFRGTGFKYNSDGKPIGGTVTSYTMLYGMTEMVVISGISIQARTIADAAETVSLSDDIAIIREALAGNDRLKGGLHANYLRGYAGNDVVSGGVYEDDLFGDDGDDKISGGDRSDNLYGGNGNDTLNGGSGAADIISGGAGSDTASYVGGVVGVVASLKTPANNTYDANGDQYSSIENLTGTSYSDILEGNANANVLTGGNGNDRLIGRAGGDTLNGGAGTDSAYYYGATAGVIANLSNASANTNDAAGDVYSSIENLVGSSYTDGLFGNGVANTL